MGADTRPGRSDRSSPSTSTTGRDCGPTPTGPASCWTSPAAPTSSSSGPTRPAPPGALHGAGAIRAALPEPRLWSSNGRAAAPSPSSRDGAGTEDAHGTATLARAPRVDVVAAVGAGDAFAAGFLSATLRALPVRDRLRHGHLMAAAALTVPGDLATPPSREHADRLAALDDAAWGRLRLGPGWTEATQRADEEVRTP